MNRRLESVGRFEVIVFISVSNAFKIHSLFLHYCSLPAFIFE